VSRLEAYPKEVSEYGWKQGRISEYYFKKLERLKKKIDVEKVTPFEASFLDDRWQAMGKYGDFMRMTEKQVEVLKNICRVQGV